MTEESDYDKMAEAMVDDPNSPTQKFRSGGGDIEDSGRCAMIVEFGSLSDLVAWFQESQGVIFPADATLFRQDSIDRSFRPCTNRTMVVKRKGDRPDGFQLKVLKTHEEDV